MLTPSELLTAAERVRRTVEADTYVDAVMDALEKMPPVEADTHSWLYGTFDVTCMLCKCRKGSPESLKPCRLGGFVDNRIDPPPPRCPNFPNPCYCTGACRTIGDGPKTPPYVFPQTLPQCGCKVGTICMNAACPHRTRVWCSSSSGVTGTVSFKNDGLATIGRDGPRRGYDNIGGVSENFHPEDH